MCNTLQSFYTCFQQLDFFTLPKLEPSENFVGNKCFVIWVIFLLNEFLEVLKYESFKNLFLHVNLLAVSTIVSTLVSAIVSIAVGAVVSTAVSAIVDAIVSAIVRICTYLYNICVLKEKVCVLLICFNFSVLILYY